jgi:superfamily I DNA/RNA helicase
LISLTDEQRAVIEHPDSACVTACAGAGKTATLVEYAKARPNASIMYIVYNRSARIEATAKFKREGLNHVRVETAHSLAYKEMVAGQGYEIHPKGNLKPQDVLEWYESVPRFSTELDKLIFAKHVVSLANKFCNGREQKIHHIDYVKLVKEPSAKYFVNRHLDHIEDVAESILQRMWDGILPITHDAYLKKFQLQSPVLPYTHVLTDEGQDSNPCWLDVFLNQPGIRVIVGDSHQSIYGYRGAIDSLNIVDFPRFTLSGSFRFGSHIAQKAMEAIRLKTLLGVSVRDFKITGLGPGKPREKTERAVLARSNLGLISHAIEAVCNKGKKCAYEGEIQNYTFMSSGTSLFDILNLYVGKPERIRDDFIRRFVSYDDLKEYQKEVDDRELGMVIDLISTYGTGLFGFIREMKEKAVGKDDADLVLSTCHKSKGAEFDDVKLGSDFINGEKILKLLSAAQAKPPKPFDLQALIEDINCLYVAITRSRRLLELPFPIWSKGMA